MNSIPAPSARVIRSRIPSDYEILAQYHQYHSWIPDRDQIRPTPELKAKKEETLRDIENRYRSSTDFILSTVFKFPSVLDKGRNKLRIDGVSNEQAENVWSDQTLHNLFVSNPSIKPYQFVPNNFPYQLEAGGNHYVMWYATSRLLKGDDEISHSISRGIKKVLKEAGAGDMDYDFAWYVNPKMTVPELAHVQVFWAAMEPDASNRGGHSVRSSVSSLSPEPSRDSSTPPQPQPAPAASEPAPPAPQAGCIESEDLDEAEAAMLAEAIRMSLEGAQASRGPDWLPI